jgi:hypothetical protein
VGGRAATAGRRLSTILTGAERVKGYGVIEEAAGVGGVEAAVAARAAAELTGTEAGVTDEQAVVERGVRRLPPSAEPVGVAGEPTPDAFRPPSRQPIRSRLRLTAEL